MNGFCGGLEVAQSCLLELGRVLHRKDVAEDEACRRIFGPDLERGIECLLGLFELRKKAKRRPVNKKAFPGMFVVCGKGESRLVLSQQFLPIFIQLV